MTNSSTLYYNSEVDIIMFNKKTPHICPYFKHDWDFRFQILNLYFSKTKYKINGYKVKKHEFPFSSLKQLLCRSNLIHSTPVSCYWIQLVFDAAPTHQRADGTCQCHSRLPACLLACSCPYLRW